MRARVRAYILIWRRSSNQEQADGDAPTSAMMWYPKKKVKIRTNKSMHTKMGRGKQERACGREKTVCWEKECFGVKRMKSDWRECGENTNIMMRVFRRYTLTIQARCIPARTLSAKNTRMKLPSRQSVKMLRTKYPNVQHPAGPLMWQGRRNIRSNSVWEKLIWGNEVWWPVF